MPFGRRFRAGVARDSEGIGLERRLVLACIAQGGRQGRGLAAEPQQVRLYLSHSCSSDSRSLCMRGRRCLLPPASHRPTQAVVGIGLRPHCNARRSRRGCSAVAGSEHGRGSQETSWDGSLWAAWVTTACRVRGRTRNSCHALAGSCCCRGMFVCKRCPGMPFGCPCRLVVCMPHLCTCLPHAVFAHLAPPCAIVVGSSWRSLRGAVLRSQPLAALLSVVCIARRRASARPAQLAVSHGRFGSGGGACFVSMCRPCG